MRLIPLSFLHTSLSLRLLSALSKTLSLRVLTGIREDEDEESEVRLSSPNSYWVAKLEMWRHSDSTTSGCIRLLEVFVEVRRAKDPSSESIIPKQPFFFLSLLMLISVSSLGV